MKRLLLVLLSISTMLFGAATCGDDDDNTPPEECACTAPPPGVDSDSACFAANDTQPAADGCNTCVCDNGGWACTEIGCGDDDSSDTLSDCENDDAHNTLPLCPPYVEPAPWVDWSNLGGLYGEFLDEQDAEGIVTAKVSIDGDAITLKQGAYNLALTWLRNDSDPPFADGQRVSVYQSQSAGDDGCCDEDLAQIWDAQGNLLLAFAGQQGLHNVSFGGETYNAATTWTDVCRYGEGDRPQESSRVWACVYGMSLTGAYQGGAFAIDLPGDATTTSDGLLEVHWPVGYRGYLLWDDASWYSQETVIEIVSVAGGLR